MAKRRRYRSHNNSGMFFSTKLRKFAELNMASSLNWSKRVCLPRRERCLEDQSQSGLPLFPSEGICCSGLTFVSQQQIEQLRSMS